LACQALAAPSATSPHNFSPEIKAATLGVIHSTKETLAESVDSPGTWALLWKWCFSFGPLWGPTLAFLLGATFEGIFAGVVAHASRGFPMATQLVMMAMVSCVQVLMHGILGVYYWDDQTKRWDIVTYKERHLAIHGPIWYRAFEEANIKAYTSNLAFASALMERSLADTLFIGVMPHLLMHLPPIFFTVGPTLSKWIAQHLSLDRIHLRMLYFVIALSGIIGGSILGWYVSPIAGGGFVILGAMIGGAADWLANNALSDLLMITNPKKSRLRQWLRSDSPNSRNFFFIGIGFILFPVLIYFSMVAWDFGMAAEINVYVTLGVCAIGLLVGGVMAVIGIAGTTANYLFSQKHQNGMAVMMHDRRLKETEFIRHALTQWRQDPIHASWFGVKESTRILIEKIFMLEKHIYDADHYGRLDSIGSALGELEGIVEELGESFTLPAETLDALTKKTLHRHPTLVKTFGLRLLTIFPDLFIEVQAPYAWVRQTIQIWLDLRPPVTTQDRFQTVIKVLAKEVPLAARHLADIQRYAERQSLHAARMYLEVQRPYSEFELKLLLMAFPPESSDPTLMPHSHSTRESV